MHFQTIFFPLNFFGESIIYNTYDLRCYCCVWVVTANRRLCKDSRELHYIWIRGGLSCSGIPRNTSQLFSLTRDWKEHELGGFIYLCLEDFFFVKPCKVVLKCSKLNCALIQQLDFSQMKPVEPALMFCMYKVNKLLLYCAIS